MKKIELPATQMADEEQLAIMSADRKVLPENEALARAIDAAIEKLLAAIEPGHLSK